MIVASVLTIRPPSLSTSSPRVRFCSDALFWGELKYFKHLAGKVQSKGTQDYPLIIGANLGKTGTSSLAAAARQMKFRAYHYQVTAFQSMKSMEAWERLKKKGVMLVDDLYVLQCSAVSSPSLHPAYVPSHRPLASP